MKSVLSTAKVSSNCFIDLDIVNNDADNILLIGNTTGFFGYYYINKYDNKIQFDIEKSGQYSEKLLGRLKLLKEIILKKGIFTIVGSEETIKYYRYVFDFFMDHGYKININTQIKPKTINKNTEYIEFLDKLISKNMKFDYIIQNPPYSGSFHLDFMNKGLDMLSEDGKMVIIEPATWLINVRKNGKAKLYDAVKERLSKHVYKVVIENLNKEFDTALYVPFSITYIDMKNEHDNIDFQCSGEYRNVNNLYDCNLIGNYDMIWSILNKIKKYGEKVGTMNDHIYKEGKTKVNEDTWFCKYGDIIGSGGLNPHGTDNEYQKTINGERKNSEIYFGYYNTGITISKNISKYCIFGTKQELENWKHFIFNNKLPLFTSIALVIDQNNTCKDVLCWLTDKHYTDEEIYNLLGITEEEQEFIDKTLKKYERHSPWFKRYLCGKDSVSNEEVQKFIDNL